MDVHNRVNKESRGRQKPWYSASLNKPFCFGGCQKIELPPTGTPVPPTKTLAPEIESEWEYAARAGTTTKYWWGDSIGTNRANCDGCGSKWDKPKTAPVSSFAHNKFGLYNTSGNVEEWTCSQYEDKYRGKEQACVKTANEIVLRGGSGIDFIDRLRSTFRNSRQPSERFEFVGFRLVRQ